MNIRSPESRNRSKRLSYKVPALLLCIGVISLVGTLGAPDIAGAAANHGAVKVHKVVGLRSVTHRGVLRPSIFDARHLRHESRTVAARSAAVPAITPTLYVNATTGANVGSCRLQAHPCLTIGYAVSVAPSSANIDVANGTYAEQVVDSASKSLNIVGASEASTIIEPSSVPLSDTDTDSSTLQYAIVDAQPGSTVNLSNLTIDGEAATNSFTDCSKDFVGVYYHDAKGAMTDVTVENIVLSQALFGCQDGLGIYAASDPSTTTQVTMSTVAVPNYDKNGITCDDSGTTCTISNSTVTGIGCTGLIAQNGIQGYDAASLTLTSDLITGNCYSGPSVISTGILFIDDAASTATSVTANTDDVGIYDLNDGAGPPTEAFSIMHSTASDATFANGLGGVGIVVDSAVSGTIESDTMKSDPGDGVALYGVSNMTVKSNKAKNDLDGIYIGGPGSVGANSTANTVKLNKVSNNSGDGIYADTDALSNSFTSNTGKNDLNYSYQDFSVGAHTAGTANTWTTNSCTPAGDSSPEGLC